MRALTPFSGVAGLRSRWTSNAVFPVLPGDVNATVAAGSGTCVVQGARPHSKSPLGIKPPDAGQDGVGVGVVVVLVHVGPHEQAETYRSGAVPQDAVALDG